MKKIISNRVYDTSTARKVGEWSSDLPVNDFGWYREDLYRKKTGEYFLNGKGGPASPYRKMVGYNAWEGAEAILPVDYEQAREWAERHLEADAYLAEFGDAGETTSEKTINVSVPESTYRTISKTARMNGRTIREQIMLMAEQL